MVELHLSKGLKELRGETCLIEEDTGQRKQQVQ